MTRVWAQNYSWGSWTWEDGGGRCLCAKAGQGADDITECQPLGPRCHTTSQSSGPVDGGTALATPVVTALFLTRGWTHRDLEEVMPGSSCLGWFHPSCGSDPAGCVSHNIADRCPGTVLGSHPNPDHKSRGDYPWIRMARFPTL
jgi:hypothetical protein